MFSNVHEIFGFASLVAWAPGASAPSEIKPRQSYHPASLQQLNVDRDLFVARVPTPQIQRCAHPLRFPNNFCGIDAILSRLRPRGGALDSAETVEG